MKKPKLLLTVGGGISGVLVLIAIVFVVLGLDGAATAEKAREKAIKELERLYRNDPFPSPENIATANENRERAEEWAADLASLLSADAPVSEEGLTGSWFKDQLYARLDALRAAAPLDDSGKPVVDPDFGFDFDRYAAVTPEDENVPKLLVQLNLIDRFVRVLYDKGILHLDGVARAAFESGSSGASSESSGRRGGRRGGRGGDRAVGPSAVQLRVEQPPAQESPVPYVRERIGLAFRAKEVSLLAILDEIDACWPYVAVSGLRIEKVGDDVRFPDEAPPKKDERVSAGPAEAPVAIAQAASENRSSRFVSGALREQPVQVELYLDLYRMEPPEPDGDADGEDDEEEDI